MEVGKAAIGRGARTRALRGCLEDWRCREVVQQRHAASASGQSRVAMWVWCGFGVDMDADALRAQGTQHGGDSTARILTPQGCHGWHLAAARANKFAPRTEPSLTRARAVPHDPAAAIWCLHHIFNLTNSHFHLNTPHFSLVNFRMAGPGAVRQAC